jgi:hypothetical protein
LVDVDESLHLLLRVEQQKGEVLDALKKKRTLSTSKTRS